MTTDPTDTSEQVIAALRNSTREARETLKDLRHAKKEAEQTLRMLVQDELDTHVTKCIKDFLDTYKQEVDEAIQTAQAKVFAKFDKLMEILLRGGKNKSEMLDIEKIIEHQVSRIDE